MTYEEKIKNMTTDELAELLCSISPGIAIKIFGNYVPTHPPYMKQFLECKVNEKFDLEKVIQNEHKRTTE